MRVLDEAARIACAAEGHVTLDQDEHDAFGSVRRVCDCGEVAEQWLYQEGQGWLCISSFGTTIYFDKEPIDDRRYRP